VSRKKSFWIAVVIIILSAAGGGYYYHNNVGAAAQEPEENPVQTTTVRSGEIIISASGAGTVIPAAEVNLAFQSGGLLAEVLVQVGDTVQAGDVLARVDDTQARKALMSAELQVVQAEEKLADQLDTVPEQQDLALAEANLALAQFQLDEVLNWAPSDEDVTQAQASLEADQAGYEAAQNKSAYDQTASSRISLEQAQQGLEDAQAAYDQAWDSARDWELYMIEPTGTELNPGPSPSKQLENERDSTASNLVRAQQNLELAQSNYNLAWAGVDDTAELNAWNQVLSAQATLDAVQAGPDEQENQSAEIQVLQAQIALADAQSALEASSKEAQLALEQAELDLKAAQEELESTALVAPMDGVVMAVAAQAGESVGTASLITVADIEQPSIEVFMDETDLNSAGVGYEVEVVFDALSDDTFGGYVVQVDPALVTVSGVPMVRAIVQLDPSSYAKPQILPIGANATVDVIGGRAENALLVPVEALNEITPGEYAVFRIVEGETVFTPVEVGLKDYTYAEILSGLELGDEVTTGIVDTK
jgi:HlyD family secretion protein